MVSIKDFKKNITNGKLLNGNVSCFKGGKQDKILINKMTFFSVNNDNR